MLTDSEKKAFRFLANIGRTHGIPSIYWNIDDIHDSGIDNFDFDPNYYSLSYHNRTKDMEIPESIKITLINWFNREGRKLISDGMDSLWNKIPEDPTWSNANIMMDFKAYTISASGEYQYPSTAEPQSFDGNLDDSAYKAAFDQLKSENPEATTFRVDYSGGGDSGYVEDYGYFDVGDSSAQLPGILEDYILNNLPGGWEINEGSAGYCIFNLNDFTAEIVHTEYYDETISDTFFEENF